LVQNTGKLTYRPAGGFSPKPGDPASKPGDGNQDNHQDGGPQDAKRQNALRDDKKGSRIGEHTNEAWQDQKVGFYYAVVEALLTTGFTEDEIGKIGGGNFCRIFDAATAGHS